MVLEKSLESPLESKEIKPVNPKGNQPEYFLEGRLLKLKHQYFGHLMRGDFLLEKTLLLGKTEGRRRRGQQRRQLDSVSNSMDMNLRKLGATVKERESWPAAVRGISASDTA